MLTRSGGKPIVSGVIGVANVAGNTANAGEGSRPLIRGVLTTIGNTSPSAIALVLPTQAQSALGVITFVQNGAGARVQGYFSNLPANSVHGAATCCYDLVTPSLRPACSSVGRCDIR